MMTKPSSSRVEIKSKQQLYRTKQTLRSVVIIMISESLIMMELVHLFGINNRTELTEDNVGVLQLKNYKLFLLLQSKTLLVRKT